MKINNLLFGNQIENFEKDYKKHLDHYQDLLKNTDGICLNFLNLKNIKDFKGYWVVELFDNYGELRNVSENDLENFDFVTFDKISKESKESICFIKKNNKI